MSQLRIIKYLQKLYLTVHLQSMSFKESITLSFSFTLWASVYVTTLSQKESNRQEKSLFSPQYFHMFCSQSCLSEECSCQVQLMGLNFFFSWKVTYSIQLYGLKLSFKYFINSLSHVQVLFICQVWDQKLNLLSMDFISF